MSDSELQIFTVGHSNHRVDQFLSLLRRHGVTALADVRSAPYSRFAPQFNKEALKREVHKGGVKYVFLGGELGGRSNDSSCYANGRVQYARLAGTEAFRSGINRIVSGAQAERIALMCTEKDPLDCHRTVLLARALTERSVGVDHILASGLVESHYRAMLRLLDELRLPRADLFRSTEELVKVALGRQEERIAHVDPALAGEGEG